MMTAMKWFYGFLKKYRLRMFFGMVLVTILAAAALASPYISKIIVDTVIKGGSDSACRDPCRACSRKGGMPV